MIPVNLKSFIADLQDATEERKIKWIHADNNAYYCNHKDYTLHIFFHYDEDKETNTYYFRIVAGKSVAPFTVAEYEEEDFCQMRNLFEAIAVNATNIDEKLKSFFD